MWSEKYHKFVLKESKIKEICDKIERMHRGNLDHLISEVNKASRKVMQKTTDLPDIPEPKHEYITINSSN